jgi:peroxiredoxin
MKLVKILGLLALLTTLTSLHAAEPGPAVGQTAPDFTLKDLDGNNVSLSKLRKKGPVLVVFFSTRCHFCHAMIPQFKAIWKKYQGKGMSLVAVNIGWESQADVEAYSLENDLPYPVLNDDDKKRSLAQAWRLAGTPTIQLVARNGEVLYRGHRLPHIDRLLARK